MGRIIPLPEMTDKQLLKKAANYGIRPSVVEALRSLGRAEAERILDSHMKNNPSRRKAIKKSHYDRIKKERGTKCECCQKADWTQICHIEPPIPGDSTSGGKENNGLLRQLDYSLIQELLQRTWLGCNKCHTNFDWVWSKSHGRTRESLECYFQHIRKNGVPITRGAQKIANKRKENNALIDKLYDRNTCQCCQQTKKTQLAHIYGEVGKVNSVSNMLGDSNEKCLNEAKKCVPLCRECHNTYDHTYSETNSQNPHNLEQMCRDKVEELGLGLKGHKQLDLWIEQTNNHLATVVWHPCELEVPIERPRCPSAKDYPPLGTKDPSYKKDCSKYRTALKRWKRQNDPGFRESENARDKARNAKKRAEDKWC